MIQKIKRPLSILLSIMMIVSLFAVVPITASAVTENDINDLCSQMYILAEEREQQDDYIAADALMTSSKVLYQQFAESEFNANDPNVERAYNIALAFYNHFNGTGSVDVTSVSATEVEKLARELEALSEDYFTSDDYYNAMLLESAGRTLYEAFDTASGNEDPNLLSAYSLASFILAQYTGTTEPTTEPATVEPTTEEPTTEEPTTEEPTTEEPTTEEPTTEEPTTEPTTEEPPTDVPVTEPATEPATEAPTDAPAAQESFEVLDLTDSSTREYNSEYETYDSKGFSTDNFSVTTSSNDGPLIASENGWTLFGSANDNIKISSLNGQNISKLVVSAGINDQLDPPVVKVGGEKIVGTLSDGVYVFEGINATEAIIESSVYNGQTRVETVTVYYGAPEPTEAPTTEPAAAEPIFVKATSADEFTADNMGSCTYDQAKAWAEANLDTLKAERAAVGGNNTWVWIVYAPTSRTGTYSILTINGSDNLDTNSDQTADIDTFKFFLNEGDIIYYVSNSAEPATEEPTTEEPPTEPDPADDVKDLINALPTTVTVNDKAQIEAARAAYEALSDDEKAKIDTDTLSKLTDAETALSAAEKAAADQAAADPVIAQINALPADVTLDDKAAVDAARKAYTDLTDDQQALVTPETIDKLIAAEMAISNLEAAKAVTDQINALPTVITLKDKADVEAARAAYNDLTDDQKNLVTDETLNKLIAAETVIANREGAKAVEDMINALPDAKDITLADKYAVNAANQARLNLPPEQADYLTLAAIRKLFEAMDKIEDLTAVDNVETLISDLPVQITLADKDNIETARAAYNALTDAQKAMVNDGLYQDLVNAESLLADLTAVDNVETLINDLPDPTQVNVVDKPDVEAARAAYNALTDTQKAIVNADILQKLADDEQRIADIIAAGVVNQMIMQNIPSADEVTLADEQTINSVREAYDALTDAQKELIEDDVYKKLTDAETVIADRKAAKVVDDQISALPDQITADTLEQFSQAYAGYLGLTYTQANYLSPDNKAIADSLFSIILIYRGVTENIPDQVTLDDKAFVNNLNTFYDGSSELVKSYIPEDVVQKLKDAAKTVNDLQSAADVEALIEALPSATDVTLDDKEQIDEAGAAYEALTDEQKELVPVDSRIKLGAVQIALALVEKDAADKAAAAEVTELIEALPSATSVTPDDKDDIEAARAAYDALTDDQKALVSAQNKLKLLLVEAALPIAIDNAAADEVEELIEALPDAGQVTVDDKDAIEEASDAYDALTTGQKQLVKLADRLKLQNVKTALQQAIDEAAADEVEAMIEDLPDAAQVTLLDKEAVDAAAEAYDNLTDNQKKLVLLADRVKLAAVKAALENAEDIAAADAVEELIEALPNAADVTVDDEEAIDAAGAAYNALTDNQKQLVVLADRIKLQNVQNALAKAINDAEAAQKVTDQINALPDGEDVTFDDLRDIAAARVAYTLLTPDQKALVPEETLNKLVVDEAVIAEIIPAEAVKVAINNLPAPEDLKLADKDLVEAVRNAYEDLTDYQKALIDEDTLAKLTDAEAAIEAIEADKAVADAVAEQIKALPSPISVTIDDKDEIEAVKAAYDELTDAQKDLVSAADKLKLAAVLIALDTEEKIAEDEAAADAVEALIEALPDAADVTVDDEEAIDAAGAAYNALTDDQKRMVVLADRIKLQNVQNALAKAINDAEAAQKVIDQINALPEAEDITFDDLNDVAAATLAYALLTHDQKELVDEDTRAKLTAAQDALDDLFEVEGVKAMINALPDAEDVTINDKPYIEAVREAYDALTDDQKALIDDDTYAKLTDAEDAIDAIEEDIAAAQEVSDQIRELPSAFNVTVDDKEDIEAVKEAYDALTDAQKAFVPTADKLKLAAVLGALDAAEKIAEDEAAADAVEELIEALPDPSDVTIDDKDDIDAAVEAYNALTDDQKRLVVLADRIKLALDDAALQKIENDIAAAEAVTEQIEALPEAEDVTIEDFDDIVAARAAYNALTDDQKALVDEDTLAKLADDEAALADAIEVEFVKALINELPAPEDVTIDDEFFIEAVRDWYDELSDAQKDMIDEETYQKLVDAEEALAALTNFTVTWMNGDEVLEVDTDLPSGATPHYDGETPTKATDDQYVYEFMGWDPDLALVTADVTYNAVFDTYLIGDVNMDGTVDIFDAVEVQKYASGKEPLNDLQLRIADVNKDGNVDILDASAIQRIAAQ